MPLDKFEYYSLVDHLLMVIIKLDSENAQDLLVKLMSKYKDNLFTSKISVDEQSLLGVEIITDLERYRGYLKS
jgi:hypothetical protein